MTEYIKKEDAIEALMPYFMLPIHTKKQYEQAKSIATTIIDSIPLENRLGWIPVSEKLPEVGQYVLASVREDYAEHNIAEHEVIICRCEEQSFWSNGIITAWMPLPEPYEEDEEE